MLIFERGFRRVWDSPTANTWVSLLARSGTLVLVLPVVLRQFSEAETAVWFVFSSAISVQGALGFGFSPSFARLIAYARGGAPISQMLDLRNGERIAAIDGIHWQAVDQLCSCMRRVFAVLAVLSLILMATVGSWAVQKPISTIATEETSAWGAWIIVVLGSSLSLWTTYYVSVLQGMNRLTEWRRAETLIAVSTAVSSCVALLLGGRLLALVAVNQAWVLVGAITFRHIAFTADERLRGIGQLAWDRHVFRLVWASAWKTGLTNLFSQGLVQATGVVQAQFGNAATTATYNFTLRVATVLSQAVQAPFITKLPELARLRATGDHKVQVALIKRGMRLTHWGIVLGVSLIAVLLPLLLPLIGSRSSVFDPLLWSLFGLTIFLDRHGAMLNQIRNLTNQPLEHFGMFGYFAVNLILMVVLHGSLGMYTFPVAMLGTQLLFSLWFSAYAAYPVITNTPIAFERTVSLPPFLLLMVQTVISTYFGAGWRH